MHALTAELGVEHEAASGESTAEEDLVDAEAHLLDRVGELVRVPSETVVAPVGVDGSEDAVGDGLLDLVVEVVAAERRMVDLDVDLDVVLESVVLEEPVDGGRVVVVLVLGGFLRLRLDQDRALEPDLVLVVHHHLQEATELIELLGHVGVEEHLVALAAAPQHVVGAAEAVGGVDAVLHLRRGVGEDVGVGVGGGAGRIAGVHECLRGAPQQLRVRLGHLRFGVVDHRVEVGAALGEGGALGRDVAVVEAVEGNAELGEELEGGVHLHVGGDHGVERRVEPRAVEGASAEDVGADPRKTVPVADGHAELLFHGLAHDDAVLVVPAEREGVVGFRTFVRDGFGDVGEEVGHGMSLVGGVRVRSGRGRSTTGRRGAAG